MKGKHTNNELSKPHNNTIPVTASRERERMRKGERGSGRTKREMACNLSRSTLELAMDWA